MASYNKGARRIIQPIARMAYIYQGVRYHGIMHIKLTLFFKTAAGSATRINILPTSASMNSIHVTVFSIHKIIHKKFKQILSSFNNILLNPAIPGNFVYRKMNGGAPGLYFVSRIAYCVLCIALGELGLFGFVFFIVHSSLFVVHCYKRSYVHFAYFDFGFVWVCFFHRS
jgi:hypothetical protein